MNATVPNSFQHPNVLIDKLAYFLSPEEEKVLNKAVREILGWQDKLADRQARISLSVFVDGKFDGEGNRICYGCGLGLQTVRKALEALNKYQILIKVGDPNQNGQLYWLQDDEAKIDWQALKSRRQEWDEQNAKRTTKATKSSLQARGVTSDVMPVPAQPALISTVPEPYIGRNGVTSDVRGGVTSDVNKETQLETQFKTPNGVGENSPGEPRKRDGPRWELMNEFICLSGIPLPEDKPGQKYWWIQIGIIFGIVKQDVKTGKTLMKQAFERLGRENVYDPGSLVKTIRQTMAMKTSKPKVSLK